VVFFTALDDYPPLRSRERGADEPFDRLLAVNAARYDHLLVVHTPVVPDAVQRAAEQFD
jgi:hypothetical protein